MLDYHHPNREDYAQGYSVRQVILKQPPTPIGGTFDGFVDPTSGFTWGKLGLGWRFVLEEL
jgi:hypothetical protein